MEASHGLWSQVCGAAGPVRNEGGRGRQPQTVTTKSSQYLAVVDLPVTMGNLIQLSFLLVSVK